MLLVTEYHAQTELVGVMFYRGGPPYTAAVRPLENGPRFEVGSFLGFCNVCTSLQFLHLHVFAFAPFAFCYFLQRSELLLSFA